MSEVASQSGAQCAWSVVSGATLRWKMWDEDCVVFNNASGQTHLLDPLAALLVRQIEEGYCPSEQIFGRIATLLDINVTPEVRATLSQMLRQLEELGLIECSHRETRAA